MRRSEFEIYQPALNQAFPIRPLTNTVIPSLFSCHSEAAAEESGHPLAGPVGVTAKRRLAPL
jgi:hypothetical protein